METVNKPEHLIKKMLGAEPGTDITLDLRRFHESLSEQEKELRDKFARRMKRNPELSDKDIDGIRKEIHDYWTSYYAKCEILGQSHLPIMKGGLER